MVRLRLPGGLLAELEAEGAESGRSWGDVARARLAPTAAGGGLAAEEGVSDGDA